ncbi:SWIM zinc finger family protein [Halosimplex aquaticum]|uniref:SWIM zinc finger family protein n=1 Tax=Halosimplex aquaticum TaxID=3026162 RepID=A0ABD5Y6L8_9EURY
MTRTRNTQASLSDRPLVPADRVDGGALDEASRRAWTEAMTVRPFGDGYLVDCEGGTEYVSLAPSDCSCPESADDARCEHVRRVAIEINLGRVPPPAERTVPCRGCDRQVAVSAADSPPALCAECHLEPGDVVVDAEADEETPLLVVSEPGRPADVVALPDDDRTVASYPGNDGYPPDEPVVEAVYPQAVSTRRDPQRYLFPLARLRRPERGRGRPPERGDEPGGDGESGRADG